MPPLFPSYNLPRRKQVPAKKLLTRVTMKSDHQRSITNTDIDHPTLPVRAPFLILVFRVPPRYSPAATTSSPSISLATRAAAGQNSTTAVAPCSTDRTKGKHTLTAGFFFHRTASHQPETGMSLLLPAKYLPQISNHATNKNVHIFGFFKSLFFYSTQIPPYSVMVFSSDFRINRG